MDNVNNKINDFASGIAVILIYFLTSFLGETIKEILNFYNMPYIFRVGWVLLYEVSILLIIIIILNKKIIKDYQDMKKNHKKYFSECFKYYLIALAVMFTVNALLIFVLKNGIAENEAGIRYTLKENPLYVYISGVMIAPLLEELVFRQGFRNIFSNKWIFILVSGLTFGSLHVILSAETLIDLLYIIPYSSFGIAFAYILYKTDNIFTSAALHCMHNSFLISLQILMLLAGVI